MNTHKTKKKLYTITFLIFQPKRNRTPKTTDPSQPIYGLSRAYATQVAVLALIEYKVIKIHDALFIYKEGL